MNVVIRAGHATRRLAERGIDKAEIEEALGNVEVTHPGQDGSTKYIGRTSTGRRLAVVAITPPGDSDTRIIKTAFEY